MNILIVFVLNQSVIWSIKCKKEKCPIVMLYITLDIFIRFLVFFWSKLRRIIHLLINKLIDLVLMLLYIYLFKGQRNWDELVYLCLEIYQNWLFKQASLQTLMELKPSAWKIFCLLCTHSSCLGFLIISTSMIFSLTIRGWQILLQSILAAVDWKVAQETVGWNSTQVPCCFEKLGYWQKHLSLNVPVIFIFGTKTHVYWRIKNNSTIVCLRDRWLPAS